MRAKKRVASALIHVAITMMSSWTWSTGKKRSPGTVFGFVNIYHFIVRIVLLVPQCTVNAKKRATTVTTARRVVILSLRCLHLLPKERIPPLKPVRGWPHKVQKSVDASASYLQIHHLTLPRWFALIHAGCVHVHLLFRREGHFIIFMIYKLLVVIR